MRTALFFTASLFSTLGLSLACSSSESSPPSTGPGGGSGGGVSPGTGGVPGTDPGDGADRSLTVSEGGYVTSGDWKGYAEIVEPVIITSLETTGFEALAAGERLCMKGRTAADYLSNPWLAVNLNQEQGSTEKGSVTIAENGIHVNVDNIAGSSLRVQLHGSDGTLWCSPLTTFGGVDLQLSNFNTKCWDGSGAGYDGSPLETISILVPGDIAGEFDFEFCLDDLAATEIEGLLEPITLDTEFTSTPDTDPANHPGFRVQGRDLYDRCGEKVELRGVNKMHIWNDQSGVTIPEIEKSSANVLRIVWETTGGVPKLDALIAKTLENDMIPMIELHDATGSWEAGDEPGKLGLKELVEWWITPDAVAMIQKYEEDLLVNIGNEVGQAVPLQDYVRGYMDALTKMRDAGIKTLLIIDASGYGQDINRLQEAGPTLFNHDPYNNVMFSVHPWWLEKYHDSSEWATVSDRVVGELKESADMGLPLIIGEFSGAGFGCDEDVENGLDFPTIPHQTIMDEAEKHGFGWLAWSWGPGNTDCTKMDMTTDGTFATLQEGWATDVADELAASSIRPHSIENGVCK